MLKPLIIAMLISAEAGAAETTYDIVVYGGTSAAVVSAVQARQMGKSVIVVSPDKHLGGLTSGGLGWTDSGDKTVIGGLARSFYHRIWQKYVPDSAWPWQKRDEFGDKGQGAPAIDGNERTMWVFEPHVAEEVFEDIVREFDIPVLRDEWLDRNSGVRKNANRIESITTLSGKEFRGKVFIDATYEGDLMAAGGVTYRVGRESNAEYGETLNGVQTANATSHQFEHRVDPYVVSGDPASGLLPRIHDGGPGVDGEADNRVQAYNYRVCLTTVPENRIPFPKPDNYDPIQYELLARDIDAGYRGMTRKFDFIPNYKTDTNNYGSFSTDDIGMNYDYPEADYERRREILREHENYQKGYFWFMANDPRVPQDVRDNVSQYGLAKDEFRDNGGWPHQIYVREARRMVGESVMTELHLRRQKPTPRPVGMGSYNMDSHNVQRYVARDDQGRACARNEGDVQVNPGGPYPIDFGALLPKESECANLLVPVCVSCTHIAYGSVRMEPVFMILGQSAATAAAIAIDDNLPVQQIDYEKLAQRLKADGQVLGK
ncbi:MAG: FAD-dependent oxidoreductase [Candidatus Hydrogenedentes bacterium]|nr:FAD-dependent oxidoreductase [Candidatus Hydrogenedentota bacterium]